MQYDWHPRNKKRIRYGFTQRKDHVKTQRKDSHLQVKERGLGMEPSLSTPWSQASIV